MARTRAGESAPAQPGGKTKKGSRWPRLTVDLRRPRDRRLVFLALLGIALVGMAVLFAAYKGIAYAESSEFCGTVCHPMTSVFLRYQRSPHAQVECAECHVGAGVQYFVQSKVDGLKSLYYAVSDTYERPIQSPVHNLRPARETCEECHTPNSFTDNIIKSVVHYDNDVANTPIQATLILKMGGWQETTGMSEGIHWHITNPVYYIAADEQRQAILWVGAEQPDGSLKEYFARDVLGMAQTAFVEQARSEGAVREMDCIDCHNRSAHLIPAPDAIVDKAIRDGLIPRDLPYARARSVELLSSSYSSVDEAYRVIDGLSGYYEEAYPAIFQERRSDILKVVSTLKQFYSEANFPDMSLTWQTNPDNEVHTPFPGCFRCHDGKHALVDATGSEIETISVKCNLCHTVPIVGRGNNILIEAPVIVGSAPASHSDFRYTIEHRTTTEAEREECYKCHGQGFCENEACHNLRHPPDMLYTHSVEYEKTGDQVCYNCHQEILCSRCHPGGRVSSP